VLKRAPGIAIIRKKERLIAAWRRLQLERGKDSRTNKSYFISVTLESSKFNKRRIS
jgi:hypothetical protein